MNKLFSTFLVIVGAILAIGHLQHAKPTTVVKRVISGQKGKKNPHKKILSFGVKKELRPFAPEFTIILFDLHGVLAELDMRTCLKNFWHIPNKFRFLRSALKKSLARDLASYDVADPDTRKYRRTTINTLNSQKVDEEVLAIVEKLKQRGYRLILFSNIGCDALNELKKDSSFAQLLDHFDGLAISCADNNYTSKPYVQAYNHARKVAREVHPDAKKFVLIDNKRRNISSSGMHGILFRSAQQLQADLQALHIL